MKIEIDTDWLKAHHNLRPDEFYFLYCKVHDLPLDLWTSLVPSSLEKLGLIEKIKVNSTNLDAYIASDACKALFYSLENKGITFSAINARIEIEKWIEEWRELFPQGISSGGYAVRGDKQGCLKKMKKFLSNHPELNKEDIFRATKDYIETKRRTNWQYMKLAHYFIEKDGVSELAALCESTKDKKPEGDSKVGEVSI